MKRLIHLRRQDINSSDSNPHTYLLSQRVQYRRQEFAGQPNSLFHSYFNAIYIEDRIIQYQTFTFSHRKSFSISYNFKFISGHKPNKNRSSFQSLDGSQYRRTCFWRCLSLHYIYIFGQALATAGRIGRTLDATSVSLDVYIKQRSGMELFSSSCQELGQVFSRDRYYRILSTLRLGQSTAMDTIPKGLLSIVHSYCYIFHLPQEQSSVTHRPFQKLHFFIHDTT